MKKVSLEAKKQRTFVIIRRVDKLEPKLSKLDFSPRLKKREDEESKVGEAADIIRTIGQLKLEDRKRVLPDYT